MRKVILSVVAAASLTLAVAGSAMAQDICSSGQMFAEHHIVFMLQAGGVNNPDAHTPGSHSGFAGLCKGLGR